MARARFDNLDPERQETILAAAAEEFASHGYAAASLNRIIEAADISKGSLYYYFDDKADLFRSVVEAAMERLLETSGLSLDELTRTNFWDTIREVGLRSIDLMREDTWEVRLAMAFPRLREESAALEVVRPILEWGRRYTADVLQRGRELQVVRRDLPLELLVDVTMAVDQAGDRWMVEHLGEYEEEEKIRELIEARIDLVRDMLDAENEGWES